MSLLGTLRTSRDLRRKSEVALLADIVTYRQPALAATVPDGRRIVSTRNSTF
jgi:hypothetical protein